MVVTSITVLKRSFRGYLSLWYGHVGVVGWYGQGGAFPISDRLDGLGMRHTATATTMSKTSGIHGWMFMGMGLFLSRRHREIVCVWGSVERVCVQHKKPCGELPRGCEGRKEMEEYERNRLNVCKTLNVCEVVVGTVSTHTRLQAHSAPENYPSFFWQVDMLSLTPSSSMVL